ncbi:MAG: VWA domain-containing protein [Chloroflexota bacterium]
MSFLWIQLLWLLLLVPVLVAAYVLLQRRRKKYALRYSSISLVKEALGRGPGMRRHIPPLLFLIGVITMIVAVARPVATITLPSQQATVILAIDVSGSMRAEDVKPNRIEAAKSAARLFVEKQPRNVLIGVVSFSGGASIVQTPTIDKESVLAAINRLVPQRRTAIGSGILTSLDAIFEEEEPDQALDVSPSNRDAPLAPEPPPSLAPEQRKSFAPAAVILLSDGVSTTGPNPLEVVPEAMSRGVRIYTVGLGTPEGTILNTRGYSIRVRLDEETLKRIAEQTDGSYFKAENETDLSKIYGDLGTQLVLKPEKTEITAGFTGAAVVILLAAGVLSMLWFNRLP